MVNFFLNQKGRKLQIPNNKIEFILLLPVLREEKVIKNTLKYLSSFKYKLDKLKVIIITHQKELATDNTNKKKKNQNTIDIVKETIPELNRKLKRNVFLHYHYPYSEGIKSDQLNYALKKLTNQNPPIFQNKNTYIGLYDADSISDKNTLMILADNAIKNNFPLVYQQPVIYFKNYDFLPNTINGLFMKSFALFQTRYSLGYEAPMFLNSSKNIKHPIGKMLYCLGHGLFIRADFLKRIGFFPTPIEDTRLGHILSYLKIDVKLLPSLAVTEVAQKVIHLLKQSSVWFTGESYFYKDYKIASNFQQINKLWAFSLIFYKFYRNFIWATEGLIFGVIILIGWFLPQKIFLLPFFIGFLIYIYAGPFYLLIKHRKLINLYNNQIKFHPAKKDYLFNFLFLPPLSFLLFLGPQLALLRFLKTKLTKKEISLPKTPR